MYVHPGSVLFRARPACVVYVSAVAAAGRRVRVLARLARYRCVVYRKCQKCLW